MKIEENCELRQRRTRSSDAEVMAEVEVDERTPLLDDTHEALLEEGNSRRGRNGLYKCLAITFTLIALGNILVVYFVYYHNCIALRVISLNAWGMPGGIGGCRDKAARIKAIAKKVSEGGFDIMALQELWMEADHTEIAASVPEGFHITGFRQLANEFCDGRVLITTCSGLAIVSRYEFKEVEFHMYTYRGTIWDGEAFAGKGVGRVRIVPRADLEIDVFTTHTIANSGTTMANNTWYRVKQVEELMDKYVSASTAQGVVLAGDFNTAPIQEPGEPYQIIRDKMINCVEEIYYKLREWLSPDYYTYGNHQNTYTRGSPDAATIDYVFHKSNCNRTAVWTNIFKLPYFKTIIFRQLLDEIASNLNDSMAYDGTPLLSEIEEKEEEISFSDHEAVETTIYLRRWSDTWPYL